MTVMGQIDPRDLIWRVFCVMMAAFFLIVLNINISRLCDMLDDKEKPVMILQEMEDSKKEEGGIAHDFGR